MLEVTFFFHNLGQGDKWLQNTIVQSRPLMYTVKLNNGREKHCHIDQLQVFVNQDLGTGEDSGEVDEQLAAPIPSNSNAVTSTSLVYSTEQNSSMTDSSFRSPSMGIRYPMCNRVPPERYIFLVGTETGHFVSIGNYKTIHDNCMT